MLDLREMSLERSTCHLPVNDRTEREERSNRDRVLLIRSMRVWSGEVEDDRRGEVLVGCIWGAGVRFARTAMDLGQPWIWSA